MTRTGRVGQCSASAARATTGATANVAASVRSRRRSIMVALPRLLRSLVDSGRRSRSTFLAPDIQISCGMPLAPAKLGHCDVKSAGPPTALALPLKMGTSAGSRGSSTDRLHQPASERKGNDRLWHKTANSECPLFGRYRGNNAHAAARRNRSFMIEAVKTVT